MLVVVSEVCMLHGIVNYRDYANKKCLIKKKATWIHMVDHDVCSMFYHFGVRLVTPKIQYVAPIKSVDIVNVY